MDDLVWVLSVWLGLGPTLNVRLWVFSLAWVLNMYYIYSFGCLCCFVGAWFYRFIPFLGHNCYAQELTSQSPQSSVYDASLALSAELEIPKLINF